MGCRCGDRRAAIGLGLRAVARGDLAGVRAASAAIGRTTIEDVEAMARRMRAMSGGLYVTLDASAIARLGNQIGAAGKNAPVALARAINHTGAKARTQMIRALVPQTGLKRKTIVKALRENKASAGGLTYTIRSHGGDIRLKYFGARETRTGVSAAPWNKRSIYVHTFMKAGWWPNRVVKGNWNGQVFERAGTKTRTQHATKGKDGMDRFEVQKSGLFIPAEMVQGASAAAFNSMVATDLPARLEHELGRVLGG